MDKIIMKDMAFYGYHGVMKEENLLGQRFIVSIELGLNLKKPGMTDAIEDTVSYAEVYEVVKSHAEGRKYRLLEALAESIAAEILLRFLPVQEVLVSVKKPQAPINGQFEYFGVEIGRRRNG